MQSVVQPFLAYKLTDQPIYLGAIGFASAIPYFFLTLPGGVLVEQWDKRKTVIWMQVLMMVQAFIMAGLTLAGVITIWHILVLALILGLANAIENTARQAMIVELVGKDALPNAIALNSTIYSAARVIGPSLSAPFLILLGDSGMGWAFFANGVSYLCVIVGLLFVRSRNTVTITEERHLVAEFMEGQRFIRKTSIVFILIFMATVPGFFGFPFIQQIPVFARDVLKAVGDTDAIVAMRNSLLVTAQGVGALVAAFTLAAFSSIRRKGLLLSVGQIAFAGGLIGLSLTRNTNYALLIMVLIGWGTVTQLALTNTLIQLSVPDKLRGRVLSTYLWGFNGIAPFGSLFIGFLTQNWGAQFAVLLGGGICLAVVLIVNATNPVLRQTVG
jgi:MFS family permease